jgi:Family of unknown function (DUF6282)
VPQTDTSTTPHDERVESLLAGAIDPHVHTGPSIAARAIDHLELAREASEVGFAAIVTKDHDYSGVMTAALITKHHPELTTSVYSSVVLNNVVGGLNPYAVEHTAAMGGKVVWLPTLAAEHHLEWEKTSGFVHPATTQKMRPAAPVPVLDADRTVLDETKEILDTVASTGMALASGHLHASETWIVFEEAQRRGVERLIFTHPEDIVQASLDDVRGLAAMGAFVEHSLSFFIPGSKFRSRTAEDLRAHIDAAGVDQTILCSDLGQVGLIGPIDGFREGIAMCIDLGYDDDEIRKMVSLNAARALGIEGDRLYSGQAAGAGDRSARESHEVVAVESE